MKKVCARGAVVRGIDIYHGDPISDGSKLKPGGVEYCFLKATEGVTLVDNRFESRWTALKNRGIVMGAYHFFHPNRDPYLQANLFLKTILNNLTPQDLPPVLDWETSDGVPSEQDRTRALIFLDRVQEATKRKPIIYGSPYFLQDLHLTKDFADYPLWIAHYGATCPLVPAPWTDWTFWQTSETGQVPGISGNCDKDVFNGTLEDLHKFIASSKI